MKHLLLFSILVFVSVTALSQQPIKVNLLEYFDKVPVPPVSAKEAYNKCGCTINDEEKGCTPDTLFSSLNEKLTEFQTEISIPPSSPQAEMMKKMQDPAYREKMENMSEEEKMQMAMQMQAAYAPSTGPAKPEPQKVLAVTQEVGKLNEVHANEAMNMSAAIQVQLKHDQELEQKHKAVDEWEAAEIKKLPIISSPGEGDSGPDPKAVFAVKVTAAKKHLAIVDEELKQLGQQWSQTRAKSVQIYTPFQKGMENIRYGDDAKNLATKKILSGGQSQMISSMVKLAGSSGSAYKMGIKWYSEYMQLQKEKPE